MRRRQLACAAHRDPVSHRRGGRSFRRRRSHAPGGRRRARVLAGWRVHRVQRNEQQSRGRQAANRSLARSIPRRARGAADGNAQGQRMAACMEPRWPVDRVSFGSRWRGRDHAGMGFAGFRRRGAQAHRLSGRGRGLCLVAGWQVSRGGRDRSGAPCGREEAAESTADRHRPFHVQGGQLRVPDREAASSLPVPGRRRRGDAARLGRERRIPARMVAGRASDCLRVEARRRRRPPSELRHLPRRAAQRAAPSAASRASRVRISIRTGARGRHGARMDGASRICRAAKTSGSITRHGSLRSSMSPPARRSCRRRSTAASTSRRGHRTATAC